MRIVGTVAMYLRMRRRAPWLSLGRPTGRARVMKRLTRPALSLAAIGWGTGLNLQAMVVIVGIVINPASAAIFATIRTLSRVVLQLTGSIGQSVGPELAKADVEGNHGLVFRIQRRISQTAVWSSAVFIVALTLTGNTILRLWTHGHVHHGGVLLVLLLIGAALEGVWLTAGTILFFTNRHHGLGLAYAILWIGGIPLAYALTSILGLDGTAFALIVVAVLMLAEVLRQSLPASHESMAGWIRSLVNPAEIWRALRALRAQISIARPTSLFGRTETEITEPPR
jgi:O-antigen/teichoic acid export membrane protein